MLTAISEINVDCSKRDQRLSKLKSGTTSSWTFLAFDDYKRKRKSQSV